MYRKYIYILSVECCSMKLLYFKFCSSFIELKSTTFFKILKLLHYLFSAKILTQQHATVFQQVAEMFKHGALVLTTGTTEVTEESTAHHHHLSRRIL